MFISKAVSIAASRCAVSGAVIHTLECEYPRGIHAQLLTHNVFSKNSSSTRAVPLEKAIAQLLAQPAQQMFTIDQAGMQGELITDPVLLAELRVMNECGMTAAIAMARHMASKGVHKQNAGRYLEPYQNIKIVLTSTEWANWDHLRRDGAAQGEVAHLANSIYEARMAAELIDLEPGEMHLPYIKRHRQVNGDLQYFLEDEEGFHQVSEDDAISISVSCCAQVSYRNLDKSLKKAESLLPKLFGGTHIHASPAEHIAKTLPAECHGPAPVVSLQEAMAALPAGVTRIDRDLQLWSGNLKNFIQLRQTIDGHDAATPRTGCQCSAHQAAAEGKPEKIRITAKEMAEILKAAAATK